MMRKMIMMLFLCCALTACQSSNENVETTEEVTTAEERMSTEEETTILSVLEFDFDNITGCTVVNGQNGNRINIEDTEMLHKIEEIFSGKEWRFVESRGEYNGNSLWIDFYAEGESNRIYRVEPRVSGIEYENCIYTIDGYDIENMKVEWLRSLVEEQQ